MNTRLTTKLCALCLLLPLAACKKQAPVTPASATAASAVVASATPTGNAPSSQVNPRFTAEVVAHEEFQRIFAPKLMFRVEPYGGNDSGWSIRIAPVSETGPAIDCIGAVETPLHGDTKIEIEPPANGSTKDPAWHQREFNYAATEPECRTAWNLMNDANYATKLSDKDREQASTKLGQIPTRHAKFAIVDARFGPATQQNPQGTIEWLKFEVDLSSNPEASAPQPLASERQTQAGSVGTSIHGVDLEKFLKTHYLEIHPDLKADPDIDILKEECPEGQEPIRSLAPFQFGDLDGDGQDEVVYQGFTCMSGTAGVDFFGVLKMEPDGRLIALPMEDERREFRGRRDIYAGLRGKLSLTIKNGRLVEVFPVYNGDEANCCPEGGERDFIYRWNGQQFVLDDIIDVPAEKSGNES